MIEATIEGSTVKLSRVLREPGFVEQLRTILDLKQALTAEIAEPAAKLMTKINASLGEVADSFGYPTSREVAICLRDAIYSMKEGLTPRWLQYSANAPSFHAPICQDIHHFLDTSAFLIALREPMPYGAHLARIGLTQTAIGIKQPGRVAYLSSQFINVHTGKMD